MAASALGLALLGSAHSVALMVAAWVIPGLGTGVGLYDAAFGALGRIGRASALHGAGRAYLISTMTAALISRLASSSRM